MRGKFAIWERDSKKPQHPSSLTQIVLITASLGLEVRTQHPHPKYRCHFAVIFDCFDVDKHGPISYNMRKINATDEIHIYSSKLERKGQMSKIFWQGNIKDFHELSPTQKTPSIFLQKWGHWVGNHLAVLCKKYLCVFLT